MNYILAAHGQFAEACLRSSEMIVGKQERLYAISFTEDMSKEDLNKKAKQILENNEGQEFTLLTDIFGGTPYNVGKALYESDKQIVGILTGLSLQLLIPLALGESVESVLEEKEGLIQFETKITMEKKANADDSTNLLAAIQNGIIHVRIDERLIHGQVATAWIGKLGATRVMIIDDEVVRSEMEKSALRAACPKNVKLSILTVENAANRLNEGKYTKDRVLIIAKTPEIVNKLKQSQVNLKQVNVGNMSKKENRIMLKKSVYLSEKEFKLLSNLETQGLEVTVQMVPNEDKKLISDYKQFMKV